MAGAKGAVMARVVAERSTATTRQVAPQRGQVRTSLWKVRRRSSLTARLPGSEHHRFVKSDCIRKQRALAGRCGVLEDG